MLLGLLSFYGCNDFLNVKPKTTLPEDELFNSPVGFQQALAGTYSQMASRNLYGDQLTMSFVSLLSQEYSSFSATPPYYYVQNLDYTQGGVSTIISSIWTSSYTAIASLNRIILATEERRSVLNDIEYARIKGEALGLRALMHLDLLRLFGPEYTIGEGQQAIPYQTEVDDTPVPPSTTKDVMDRILADLDNASQLLEQTDPILQTEAISTTVAGRAILNERRSKMNYYAVKGLEARARLYKGDHPGANSAALEVVEALNKFPFVTPTAASAAETARDRLYMSELVLMFRVRDIRGWTDGPSSYFQPDATLSVAAKLTRPQSDITGLYNSGTDYRLIHRFKTNQAYFLSKYDQTWRGAQSSSPDAIVADRLDQLVPVLRVSELYYILAETAPSVTEAVGHLNKVRAARAIASLPSTLTPQQLTAEIELEYRKELYGEGQLFYFYKRMKAPRMQWQPASTVLAPEKYVLPIPDDEKDFNPGYN